MSRGVPFLREGLLRLLLAGASLVLGALALEGLARVVVWNWTREPDVVRHPFAQFDAELGWSKPPGARGILRRPEYRVPLAINSLGLRGPEIPLDKPADTLRVLLVGDSFTEGYTVPEEQTLRSRLEVDLGRVRSRPVQVINGGTAGWGTDQEVLFYERTGRRLPLIWSSCCSITTTSIGTETCGSSPGSTSTKPAPSSFAIRPCPPIGSSIGPSPSR